MQNSKLIDLLSKLSSKDLTKFSDYVHSPYFNKHKEVTQLCEELVYTAPKFDHPRRLNSAYLYAKIYPQQTYNNRKFNHLSSQLLQLLYDFLAVQRCQQESAQKQLWLLEELRKYRAEKHYPYASKRHYKILEQSEDQKAQQYFYQYHFHKEQNAKFIDEGGRQYNAHLQEGNNALDLFFVLEKLQVACDMASRNIVIQSNYEWTMLDTVLDYVEQSEYAKYPILQAYKAIFKLLTSKPAENERYYQQLKQLLEAHRTEFSRKDLMGLYDHALNYAIKQINQGAIEYYAEALDHYIFLVESQLIFMDGYLLGWDYKNIVTIALRQKKYDWTAQFIEEYQHYLPPDIKETGYYYNLASLYYAKADYGAALECLHNVEFKDASYYIGAKIIQLKSYYELDAGEALYSLLEAFNSYLRRHQNVSTYRMQANANLIKLTKKLYRLKSDKGILSKKKYKVAYDKFQQRLATLSPIANKDWLEGEIFKLKI
ncbi:MAG: hypothetical protein GY810_27415 [Aureispira sp.]|nr:hypothetical protein [Aureispira sp.]